MGGTPSCLSHKIQILGAVVTFSFSVGLALRKAHFALKYINQPFAVLPAALAFSFVLILTLIDVWL